MTISIFFSFFRQDEVLRDQVAEALSTIKRSRVTQEWHDRKIQSGQERKNETDRSLNHSFCRRRHSNIHQQDLCHRKCYFSFKLIPF